MNDDVRDLLAGAALGVLSPADEESLPKLVERDGAAAAELRAFRATVASLEAGLARAQPSPDLFDRILAEVEHPPAEAAAPIDLARARRRRRRVPQLAAAGVAAAAAVVLALGVFSGGRGDPDVRAAVAGTPEFTGVTGDAALYSPDRSGGVLVLNLENVPPPPSGHHYEVWVLRSEGGGAMEAVGSFTPAEEDAQLEFQLPGPGDYRAVDVSVEPDGGPAEHSTVSLAGGRFVS
jgi:anti-sigma-K factor RskA